MDSFHILFQCYLQHHFQRHGYACALMLHMYGLGFQMSVSQNFEISRVKRWQNLRQEAIHISRILFVWINWISISTKYGYIRMPLYPETGHFSHPWIINVQGDCQYKSQLKIKPRTFHSRGGHSTRTTL